jgi:hypothetical protein
MIPASFYRFATITLSVLIVACSTGKRALEKGDYDKAIYQAVNRLQKDTDNKKALSTLKSAYDFAIEDHQTKIREAKLSSDVLRWEQVIQEYEDLNRIADEIRKCPACREVVPEQNKFISELAEAKLNASDVRYARGLKLLAEKNRQSAKQAYLDFERAEQLYPNYKDAKQKMDDAYWAAVLKVVVEPVEVQRGVYELSNEYFQNKIFEYLENYESKSFIKFYTPKQAKQTDLVPDQVLSLSFDDFVVGQTYVKERVEDVKRDSVKIGTSKDKDVYGTVTAKVSVFERTITSTGLLDFKVLDWRTKNIISQEKMPGTFVWKDQWGSYRGDERALSDNYLKIANKRESPPPAPQALFLEFTKPIFSQLTGKIKTFYSHY